MRFRYHIRERIGECRFTRPVCSLTSCMMECALREAVVQSPTAAAVFAIGCSGMQESEALHDNQDVSGSAVGEPECSLVIIAVLSYLPYAQGPACKMSCGLQGLRSCVRGGGWPPQLRLGTHRRARS